MTTDLVLILDRSLHQSKREGCIGLVDLKKKVSPWHVFFYEFRKGHMTVSRDWGHFLSLWWLGGLQTQSGLTTFPTAVWGMDCGPEGMCEAQHWSTKAVLG